MHYECLLPNFAATGTEVQKRAKTDGTFTQHCPEAIPIEFAITREELRIEVRVRGEWLDLRARVDGRIVPIAGPHVRAYELDGYTHMARVDELVANVLVLSPPGFSRQEVPFTLLTCTCVSFDAI